MRLLIVLGLVMTAVVLVGFTCNVLPPETEGGRPPEPGELIHPPDAPPPWEDVRWFEEMPPDPCEDWDEAPVPGFASCQDYLDYSWSVMDDVEGGGAGAAGGGPLDANRDAAVLGALLDGLTMDEFSLIEDRLGDAQRMILRAIAEGTGAPFDLPCSRSYWKGQDMGWVCQVGVPGYDVTCTGIDPVAGAKTGCTVQPLAAGSEGTNVPPILRAAYECAWLREQGRVPQDACSLEAILAEVGGAQ
jgi:hypothetical protein